jgi:hypothetical protein
MPFSVLLGSEGFEVGGEGLSWRTVKVGGIAVTITLGVGCPKTNTDCASRRVLAMLLTMGDTMIIICDHLGAQPLQEVKLVRV